MTTTSTISGVTNYVSSADATTSSAYSSLDMDSFLTLFLAQLQNQDPLNPMDATDLSSQLAQYSNVEQLYNVNDNLETLIDSQDSSNTYQVLDMIGKEVEADGDSIYLGSSGTASGGFTIESDADCAAVIYDESGNVVKTIDLGGIEAGNHTFEWDGTAQDGDEMSAGTYTFEVVAEDAAGSTVTAETKIQGIIDKISMDGDEPVLYIGDLALSLSYITEITLAEG